MTCPECGGDHISIVSYELPEMQASSDEGPDAGDDVDPL